MKFLNKIILVSLTFFLFVFSYNFALAETSVYSGNISVDTTWTKDGSPYVIYASVDDDNGFTVNVGATLTIDAGTVVKFDYYQSLNVSGDLIVNGTSDEKVYFTSLYDDSVGGDTDFDEGEFGPYNDDWAGVIINNGGNSNLKNLSISYAETAFDNESATSSFDGVDIKNCQYGVYINGGSVDLKNSSISNIFGDVFYLDLNSALNLDNSNVLNIDGDLLSILGNGNVDIDNSSIDNIGGDGINAIDGSTLNIKNSSIENISGDLLTLGNNSVADFSHTSIKEIRGDGISGAYGSLVEIEDSSLENISGDAFFLYSNCTTSVKSTTLYNMGGDLFDVFRNSSLTFSNSNVDQITGQILYMFDRSGVDISNSTIENSDDGILYYQNSTLNIENSNLRDVASKDSWAPFLDFYSGSRLSFLNSTLQNISGIAIEAYGSDWDGYATTSLDISSSTISSGDNIGLEIFGSKMIANISKSIIKNFVSDGVRTFSYPIISITDSEISNNNSGIISWGTNLEISNSIISNNKEYGIFNNPAPDFPSIRAINNWWGDVSGPFNAETNASGTANKISSNVNFSPWLTEDPSIIKKIPVIIVPGIMGTQLIKDYGDKSEIWPNMTTMLTSFYDEFLTDLLLKPDGTENPDFPITVGDIMSKVTIAGNTVLDTWDGMINTLTAGGYVEGKDLFVFPYDWRKGDADDAVLLKNKIDDVIAQTGASKVDIIAHSMGGLVAQKYVVDNGADKIDKLFFIGTPHLGAPKAYKALMYGDDMGIRFGFSILQPAEVKLISQNMPSVFDLLPSRIYVDGDLSSDTATPVKYVYDATASTSKWLDYDETKNFMINHGVNEVIFPQAENLHADTDSFNLPVEKVYNFSGCGLTKTVSRIIEKREKSWTSLWQKVVDDYSIDYTNGDETVPLISAVGPFGNHNYYVKGSAHSELPSASGVPDTIFSILSGSSLPSESNISTSIDSCDVTGRAISTHSPVIMDIYDDENNHTGSTSTGDIEYGIPGVSYDTIGSDTFVFLPQDGNYHIVITATDTGAYNFYTTDIGPNDLKISQSYWNDIPLKSLAEKFEIDFSSTNIDYIIKADEDNDGVFETSYSPSAVLSSSSVNDLVPPQTVISVSKDGIVSFTSTDDSAGVLKTEYSLDNSDWLTYSAPFYASGKFVNYFSTDKAGNVESTQSVIVSKNEIAQSGRRRSTNGTILSEDKNLVVTAEPTPNISVKPIFTENENNTQSYFPIFTEEKEQPVIYSKPITGLANRDVLREDTERQVIVPNSSEAKASISKGEFTATVASSGIDIKPIIMIVSVIGLCTLVFINKKIYY